MKSKLFLFFLLITWLFIAPVIVSIVNVSAVYGETGDSGTLTDTDTSADTFNVQIDTVVNDIYPTQTAKFLITINNTLAQEDEFKFNFGAIPKWSFTTDPASYLSGVNVGAGKPITFPLSITPSSDALGFGLQNFKVMFNSKKTGISKEASFMIFYRNPTPPVTKYQPTVAFNFDIPEKIDPRQPVTLKVLLDNKNPLALSDVLITIRSDLYNIDRIVSLASLEKKTELFTVNYNPTQPPKEDTITVKIKVGDVEFTPATKQIEIIEYTDIPEKKDETSSFFKWILSYTYTNNGNVKETKEVKVPTSLFMLPFMKTSPKAALVKDDNGRSFSWNIELESQESKTVLVTKNYRPLIYIILLIIIGIVLYYIFRSPIVIKKETKIMNVDNQGISDVKILLHLKNRTNKSVEDVKLVDRIPQMGMLDTEFSVGTLHPSKVIKHEHKGTIIRWDIPTLEPFEERIISYTIQSKLKIIGGFSLPQAVVKFKGKGESVKRTLSNKITAK